MLAWVAGFVEGKILKNFLFFVHFFKKNVYLYVVGIDFFGNLM